MASPVSQIDDFDDKISQFSAVNPLGFKRTKSYNGFDSKSVGGHCFVPPKYYDMSQSQAPSVSQYATSEFGGYGQGAPGEMGDITETEAK